jgi:UDP-N-acetylmuramoylalanine--D-glutamate ligase
MMIYGWQGRSALIIGAARQGMALARFLCNRGVRIIINDQRTADQLGVMGQSLEDCQIRWELGGHPLSLLDEVDVVCLSGGIPLTLPIVQEALRRGMTLTNDTQVFLEYVPCQVIGITGSAGKTTTTTLVGRIAQVASIPPSQAWVGGNIGLPLIDQVDEIMPRDTVVLELSSFQLEQVTQSPEIAAILNITPNHLDRHGTMEAYIAAKTRILEFQTEKNTAVLCREDPISWSLRQLVKGRLVSFGWQRPSDGSDGVYLANGSVMFTSNDKDTALLPVKMVELRGAHNLLNVLAACAISVAAGFPPSAMQAGVDGFAGVAHRLEFVRKLHGSTWYNDSIATTPERTLADIRSFDEPMILLLGGRDKNLPWNILAEEIHQRVDHVIVFGEASEKILKALGCVEHGQRPFSITRCEGLHQAVQAADHLAESGDIVLLSPGGTSFDEFRDFEERGERFREWVNQLI